MIYWLKKIFDLVGKRTIIFYLVVIFASYFLFDFPSVQNKYQLKSLNRLRPGEFSQLVSLSKEPNVDIDQSQIENYQRYFRKVADYVGTADAYGMLGYCVYLIGDKREALTYFKKARDLSPEVIWFSYDLGILYYERKDFKHAAEFLKESLNLSPSKTLEFMFSSRVYKPIIIDSALKIPQDFLAHIKRCRENTMLLLIDTYFQLGDFKSVVSLAQESLSMKNPGEEILHYYLGLAYSKLGSYPQAVLVFKQAIEKNPQFYEAYQQMGLAFRALKQEEAAVKFLNASEVIKDKQISVLDKLSKIKPAVL